MNKKILAMIGLSSTLLLTACANDGVSGSDTVMEIGDYKMTTQEFYEKMRDTPFTDGLTLGEAILEEQIIRQVFEEEYGSKVTDKDIDEEFEIVKKGFEDEEHFQETLSVQDLTEDELKEDIRMSLLVLEAFKNKVEFTDEEVEEFYEDMIPEGKVVRHILVEDEETIKEVQQKLEDGENFADLVKEYSEDLGSSEDGGEYELVKGRYIQEFEDTALELELNEVSDIVESDFGYHIIELIEDAEKESLEDSRDNILNELYREAIQNQPEVYEEIIFETIDNHKESITIHEESIKGLVEKVLTRLEPIEMSYEDEEDYELMPGETLEGIVPEEELELEDEEEDDDNEVEEDEID